jgi:uncharacterized protein (DUF736 family)
LRRLTGTIRILNVNVKAIIKPVAKDDIGSSPTASS